MFPVVNCFSHSFSGMPATHLYNIVVVNIQLQNLYAMKGSLTQCRLFLDVGHVCCKPKLECWRKVVSELCAHLVDNVHQQLSACARTYGELLHWMAASTDGTEELDDHRFGFGSLDCVARARECATIIWAMLRND